MISLDQARLSVRFQSLGEAKQLHIYNINVLNLTISKKAHEHIPTC